MLMLLGEDYKGYAAAGQHSGKQLGQGRNLSQRCETQQTCNTLTVQLFCSYCFRSNGTDTAKRCCTFQHPL